MSSIRETAVAGLFYPDDAHQLQNTVNRYLAAANSAGPCPKALIAPHAGYIYSGPIAASAYARLTPCREVIKRVILLGPAHRVHVHGLAASSATAFKTPLGEVPIDKIALDTILLLPQVEIMDAAHVQEHSLEVQLPFLQTVLQEFSIVPLVVGETTIEQVAEVLEQLWGGAETLIVISSDLSHYYPYTTAQEIDSATARAIEQLDLSGIKRESACGRVPIRGLLKTAQVHNLHGAAIDLRNSGDTAGPRDRVVGYGAFVFSEN